MEPADWSPPPAVEPVGGRPRPAPPLPARHPPDRWSPASLRRRCLAGLIDLALVAALTVLAAWTQLLPGDDADRAALVSVTVQGTAYRWTADGLWLTVLVTVLTLALVTTLIPANNAGRSPGRWLLGTRVLTVDGRRAQLHHHLVRSAAALVDLAPYVLPGLVGWAVAARSPRRQRLGDRLAGTVVVDRRHPERPADPAPGAASPPSWPPPQRLHGR